MQKVVLGMAIDIKTIKNGNKLCTLILTEVAEI